MTRTTPTPIFTTAPLAPKADAPADVVVTVAPADADLRAIGARHGRTPAEVDAFLAPPARAGDYTDAPATRLLAVHCLICNRPLLDAVSVEVGIGPVCRGRVDLDAATLAARPEVNTLVHEAALATTNADRRVAIADEVRALGFVALADRIVERFLSAASVEVQAAHGVEATPGVVITSETTAKGAGLVVAFDSYRPGAVAALKNAIGYRERRWDSTRSAWSIRDTPRNREKVATVLADNMGGDLVLDLTEAAPAAPVEAPVEARRPATSLDADAAVAVDVALGKGARLYQAKGVHWLATVGMKQGGALLADDMGLGKTMQSLLALPLGGRALVVAPKSLVGNWRNEVRTWRPDLVPVIVTGKTWRLPAAGEVVITNYAALPKRLAVKVEGSKWTKADLTPDEVAALASTVLVLDEAEAVSNWKAARTARIRNLRFGSRATWALTGTPMSSRPAQLWGLVATLGMSKSTFGSWDRFVGIMGGTRGGYRGRALTFDADRVDTAAVVADLAGVMLRRTRADALPELPPKTYLDVTVATPRALAREMDAAYARWPEAARGDLPADATGYATVRRQLAESRVGAMIDRVNLAEIQGEALVVYSAHRAPIEALRGREGWAVITGGMTGEARDEAVRAFQAGELRGIGITSAGARGLTLTHASRMLLVDLPWTPAEVDQVEARICRLGQTAAGLRYERLVSDHPMDLRVLGILDAKRALGAASVDAAAVMPAGPTAHVEAR